MVPMRKFLPRLGSSGGLLQTLPIWRPLVKNGVPKWQELNLKVWPKITKKYLAKLLKKTCIFAICTVILQSCPTCVQRFGTPCWLFALFCQCQAELLHDQDSGGALVLMILLCCIFWIGKHICPTITVESICTAGTEGTTLKDEPGWDFLTQQSFICTFLLALFTVDLCRKIWDSGYALN